jgi:hypothetical protein
VSVAERAEHRADVREAEIRVEPSPSGHTSPS